MFESWWSDWLAYYTPWAFDILMFSISRNPGFISGDAFFNKDEKFSASWLKEVTNP